MHLYSLFPRKTAYGSRRDRPEACPKGEQALTYADAAAYDYKKSILGGQARAAGDKGPVPTGPEDRRGEH